MSPTLDEPPAAEPRGAIEDWSVLVIQYLNTDQEEHLFVPRDQSLNEGELYRLDAQYVPATNGDDPANGGDLLDVRFRPIDVEEFEFDMEEGDEFELFDPAGNLVAAEFHQVDEEGITIDDEFL